MSEIIKEKQTEASEDSNEQSFDKIVNLISEVVVIKAQLQQLTDMLIQENQQVKTVSKDIYGMNGLAEEYEKELYELGVNLKDQGVKRIEKGINEFRTQLMSAYKSLSSNAMSVHTINLNELSGRFGKILGDLQNELVKLTKGTSSISILQVLLVKLDRTVYAFPLESVLEILKINEEEIYSVDGNETIKLREHALGLIHLPETIGIDHVKEASEKEKHVVVISDGDERIGVIVDSLIGEEDIVVKALSRHFGQVRGIRGASILGDGQVAILIDPVELIKVARNGL